MTNKEEEFEAITKEMLDLYNKKNHDYGDSFNNSLNKRGLVAAIVRMEDKFNRIDSLHSNPEIGKVNEKLDETFIDLANYAVMSIIWLRSKKV